MRSFRTVLRHHPVEQDKARRRHGGGVILAYLGFLGVAVDRATALAGLALVTLVLKTLLEMRYGAEIAATRGH